MIKLLFVLTALLNQNDFLIQQDTASVRVYDVDSYIHDLPAFVRQRISTDKVQLEKDILSMINMNIVYDYIQNSGLIDEPVFQKASQDIEQKSLTVDNSFVEKLNIKPDNFKNNYRQYLLKKSLYSILQEYIKDHFEDDKLTQLARDRFLINKIKYQIPEKRDLGMIKISKNHYDQAEVMSFVKSLMAKDTLDDFKDMAKELSEDKSTKLNNGLLGQFHQQGFRYPFADKVFTAELGTVPVVFEKDGFWYIVRVNEIIPVKQAQFEHHRAELVEKIRTEMMQRKFQSIIDEYAQHEVIVNDELVDDIFSRYEVFR